MMKTFPIAAVSVIALTALLTSCTPSPEPASTSKQLTVGRVKSIDGIDGDSCVGGGSIQTMPMIYGQVLAPAPDGSGLTPGIVEKYVYDAEAKTYTLTISSDAVFSDGAPVTAKDLAFSIADWRAGTNSGAYYEMIADQRVTNDSTVVIDLTHEDTFLPSLLTWCTSTVYPANFGGKTRAKFFEAPIGAGPYALKSWNNPGPSEILKFKANPHGYLGKKNLTPTITVKTTSDISQQLLAFEAGELDIIEDIGADDVALLAPKNVAASAPSYAMDLMLNSADSALSDPRVRQAISLGIDRKELVEALYKSTVPAKGILPINVPNSVPGDSPLSYNPKKAQQLLKEANAEKLSFELGFESGQSSTSNVANLIERQLSEIGVTVTLRPIDQATTYAMAGSGKFQALMSGVAAISPSAFDPVGFVMFAWYPWTGADGKVIGEQYAAGTSTFDDDVRDQAVATIEDDAFAQSTVIGLYNQPSIFAISSRVKGFKPTPFRYWQTSAVTVD